MATLVILRHAQAVPGKADDHARPLTPRGRDDAAAAGRALQPWLDPPVRVLASDARRTIETAEAAFPASNHDVDLHESAALYNAAAGDLLIALRSVPDTVQSVVLVGHNPGVSELAEALAREGTAANRARLTAGLPTAGSALFTVEGAWRDVAAGEATLRAVILPNGGPGPA